MRVRILGAGIVGLSVADELIRRGHDVTVVDPSPGSGASYAAAGMLSPAGEAWYGEEDLTRLCLSSLALWPEFAGRLGVPVHTRGTLLVGADAGDVQQVERQLSVLDLAGVSYERLGRRDLLSHEPGLGRVAGGAFLAEDHSVDPRAVVVPERLVGVKPRLLVIVAEQSRAERRVARLRGSGARERRQHEHEGQDPHQNCTG